jgi:hypothetical protein
MNFHVTLWCRLFFILFCQLYGSKTFSSAFLDVGFSLVDFDYQEFADNGRLLNHETGKLSGAVIYFAQTSPIGNLVAALSSYSNEVDYQGRTQSGFPVRTRTKENNLDFSLQVERPFQVANQGGYYLYGGLGYHRWDRAIQSTATAYGLFETYQWMYGSMGVRKAFALTQRSTGSVDYRLTYPIHPEVEIDAHRLFDEKVLYPVGQVGDRVSMAWQYQFRRAMSIRIQPYMERWRFSRSQTEIMTRQGVKTGYLFEPQSETIIRGVTVYFSYAF